MTRGIQWLTLALTCLAAGCATTLERPFDAFDSKTIEIAPNAFYESCVTLEAGDRLLFSYVVDPAMTFSLRRHIGNADVSYVVRDAAREDGGIFFVPESNVYCLHWAPPAVEVTWPTLLKYSIHLNNKPTP